MGDLVASKPQKLFKIIIIGDSDVGKTCLTYRLDLFLF